MIYDTVITGSMVITGNDSKRCDIAIANGQIASLGEGLEVEKLWKLLALLRSQEE